MNSGLCLTFVTLVNITDLVLQVYCLLGANNFSPTLHSFKVKLRVSTHLNNGVYFICLGGREHGFGSVFVCKQIN